VSEEGSRPGGGAGSGFPHGAGGFEADDVVAQGDGRHFPALNWRPSRGAALLGALGLLAGLAAGYAAGDRHAVGSAPPPRPSQAAPAAAPASPAIPELTQSTTVCSAQIGDELQLGVQVTNEGDAAVALHRVAAVLPMGGLKVVAQQWAPCGALQDSVDQQPGRLVPGASIWFTVTFKVLKGCPSTLPVLFTVGYDWHGQPGVAQLPGFSDLSEVPYTGCLAS
jgi:hypothetical protein